MATESIFLFEKPKKLAALVGLYLLLLLFSLILVPFDRVTAHLL